jgi:exodeoxyribonuclease VII large subunit
VWVAGEISNFKHHSSGHLYLTLKDTDSQLPAVMWRSNALRLRFKLADGLAVIARGRVSVYPAQGKYQFYIEELVPKGLGALELAFRQLHEKLAQRGWFDAKRKKPLPRFPRRIALVTSRSGAAIRDMQRIILRRWPAVEILICDVSVQGDGAALEIASAIHLLNELACVDVMVVGRGGGSLEDLWAFNEEIVAEAIFRSNIPVISAVGHEVDFTIADFVADRRAATPSEAAEIVVPDFQELSKYLASLQNRLAQRVQERLLAARERLNAVGQRRVFRQPLAPIGDLSQKVDAWAERLERAVQAFLQRRQQRLEQAACQLQSLSPLNVLGRGYSLTRTETEPTLLRSAAAVAVGTRIRTRLAQGQLVSRVEEVHAEEPEHDGRGNQDLRAGPR